MNLVRVPLSECGLLLKQRISFKPETDLAFLVTEIVLAESGESESIEIPIFFDPDPSIFGSRITYIRRYSILTALGLAPEDDDDGEADRVKRDNESRPERPRYDDRHDHGNGNERRERAAEPDMGECPDCGGRMKKSKYPDRETGEYYPFCLNCYRNRSK